MSPFPEGSLSGGAAAENGLAGGEMGRGGRYEASGGAGPSLNGVSLPGNRLYSLLPDEGCSDKESMRRLRRCIVAAAKGFSIGAGLKGGLALFAILSRLRSRRISASLRKAGSLSNAEAVSAALQDTLRYGLFLGTFAGTFASVDEAISALGGNKRTAKWRALVAGAIAGPSMLLTGPKTQHTSLALYILMRAAVLASRCGIKSKRFGNVCKPLTWRYGDIFLMCLSSSQILAAYILKQDSLPPSYMSFLKKHGAKDSSILDGVKDIANGSALTKLNAIENYYKSTGVDLKLDPNMKLPCPIIHGNQSCTEHALSFFVQAYGRALPFIFLPYTILWKSLIGTARSSLFLSVFCSSAWVWTCTLFRLFKKCSTPLIILATFPTGLALAIEKKTRRMEISLYCFARAIESFFTCLADAGYTVHAGRLKRADVVVFSFATAIIMHCYDQEREVFRSKYLNVLDWVFGVPPSLEKDSKGQS
ncbi:unnamed protein product [Spirodela intermedia]|uniref:Uncharacterized protein n=1 Tax=Spirodela intermedia TaxID=51605 RepID=A0A7I8IRD5_SPIIN|nr:unnamed protein product [Spirodela intermedia]CAA6659511.1 unnamed protein product [Spirodela intermedia]